MRALAIVALLATTAQADGETTTSYRRVTLATDAISAGVLVTGLVVMGGVDENAATTSMVIGGLGALFLATPIVHGVRGHGARAVGSFFMRAGLTAVGAAAGLAADCSGQFCEFGTAALGGLVGLGISVALDAAFLTDELALTPIITPSGVGVATRW
jgi:hypothetical protein